MSAIQKLFIAILPRGMAEAAEAESRRWMMRCRCGHEQSVWDAGGVRYKAAGNPRRGAYCSACGKTRMHLVYHLDSPPASLSTFCDATKPPDDRAKPIGDQAKPAASAHAASRQPTGARILFRVLAIVGLVILGVTAVFLTADGIFAMRAASTSGQVVRLVVGRGARPVVAYRVRQITHEVTGRVGTSPPAYAVGETVSVLYLPHQPQRARIDTFADRYLLSTIFGGIGAALFGIGVLGSLWTRQRETRRGEQILFGETRDPYLS